jgi:hypothetical protein
MGEQVPLLQEPPEVLGLPRQLMPQAPQLVVLVFRFTCTNTAAWGWSAGLATACNAAADVQSKTVANSILADQGDSSAIHAETGKVLHVMKQQQLSTCRPPQE